MNGVFSKPLHVISGVPKGSVLGPLLLLNGIAELYIPLSAESKLVMYADDILLYSPIRYKHLTINFCSRMLRLSTFAAGC